MYRSMLSWPSHKLEVSGQLHVRAALPQESERAPQPVWMAWTTGNACPYWDSNHDSSVLQPVAKLLIYYPCLLTSHNVQDFFLLRSLSLFLACCKHKPRLLWTDNRSNWHCEPFPRIILQKVCFAMDETLYSLALITVSVTALSSGHNSFTVSDLWRICHKECPHGFWHWVFN